MTSSDRPDAPPPQRASMRSFERRDVAPRHIVYAMLGLFGIILLAGITVAGLFLAFSNSHDARQATALETAKLVSSAPRLQVKPSDDRDAITAEAEGKLQAYGWVDRKAGRVRIPIEQAMQLLAQQGWSNNPKGASQ